LRTSPSLTYSDHLGAISALPHLSQVVSNSESRMDATVVKVTSLFLFCRFESGQIYAIASVVRCAVTRREHPLELVIAGRRLRLHRGLVDTHR
jgi:hypothetical protein